MCDLNINKKGFMIIYKQKLHSLGSSLFAINNLIQI
jgi:hypothetical protein